MPKFIQINTGRAGAAHDLAYREALQRRADILIISEPNKKLAKRQQYIADERLDVAAYILNRNVGIIKHSSGAGFVRLDFETWSLFCGYISPNISLDSYQEQMDGIMMQIRGENIQAVIAGDMNAKSPLWGSPAADRRGNYLAEWAAEIDLVFLNSGAPTFERGSSKSHLDITCATRGLAAAASLWEIIEGDFLTLHRPIEFDIRVGDKRRLERQGARPFLCPDKYCENLARRLEMTTCENAKALTEIIAAATKESLVSGRRPNRPTPYWWDAHIEGKKKDTDILRRIVLRRSRRENGQENVAVMRTELAASRKELARMIQKSKREKWRSLCEELEGNVWGDAFNIAVKKLGAERPPYELADEAKIEICKTLFPQAEPRVLRWSRAEGEDVAPFTLGELAEAANEIRPNKAGGPDRIPPEAVKMAVKIAGTEMLEVFNKLLREQSFPKMWKEAAVILIGKAKAGDSMDPSRYRPICLISVLGKLYEKLLKARLEREIEGNGGLSPRQYGFRKGRSTIDAVKRVVDTASESRKKWVVLVTVDIKNAFNTAPWDPILNILAKKGISKVMLNLMDSYLSYRTVKVGKQTIRTNMGVPQGSVLGPLLWNVLYDDLLERRQEEGVSLIAFADDLAVMVESNSVEELRSVTNEALRGIARWTKRNNLEIAPHKTEAIVMKGPRRREGVRFRLDRVEIACSKAIKYLGIMIDTSMLFGQHAQYAARKAEKSLAALNKILPNMGGPGHCKRQILYGVVQSVLLYGSPVWAGVFRLGKYKNLIQGVQRRALIRVISGYRTVATSAVQVIAGVPPISLMAEERGRIYLRGGGREPHVKAEERELTLQLWQAQWREPSETGIWTRRLIPNVVEWVKCEHREVEHFLAQFLSGHGAFRQYTFKIKKTPDERCIYCGDRDTAEHTVLECPRWVVERTTLQILVGLELDAQNIIQMMIRSRRLWREIHAFIKGSWPKRPRTNGRIKRPPKCSRAIPVPRDSALRSCVGSKQFPFFELTMCLESSQ